LGACSSPPHSVQTESQFRELSGGSIVLVGMPRELVVVGSLTDDELDSRFRRLVSGERQVLVIFLAHLAEFDRRRGHEPRSFPSLFEYCTKRLGLSEAEAYCRIRAARLIGDFPQAMGMLARGEIHLSALVRLSPHLTQANAEGLLVRASGKTRREVERIAAELEPFGPQADVVRALPPPPSGESGDFEGPRDDRQPELVVTAAPPDPPSPPDAPAQASQATVPNRLVRISFTASEHLLARIELAKGLLRHKYPVGRLEDVVGEAIESLLDARDPRRRIARKAARRRTHARKRGVRPSRSSRRIPQGVQDEVWSRDGGRCAFVARDGRRCEATEWLEFDHLLPWALGGCSDDPANIRLLCRTHNQHAARQVFGPRKG